MFTDFFIKRPVFSSVCSLIVILVGVVGYGRLPVKEYPAIDPPVVSVTTTYLGANPSTVETEVTEILEAQINGVEGIKTMTSESRESVSSITVQFNLDRDIDVAAQDVSSRVSQAVGRLPDEAETPVVRKQSGDASPIMWFSLYTEDGSISNLELSDYADRFLVDALETVPGVSNIIIGGERRYAMRLWIDPQKLAARNVTILDVENALRDENLELPSGRIEGESAEYPIRTLGRLQDPAEYEELVIRTTSEGIPIRFKDIGRAEIGAEDERSFVRFKGKPAVGLGIVKLSTANILDVAAAVKAKMEQLKPSFPAGLKYELPVDDSEFVRLAIDEVWSSLYLAVFLVILVIFFFLRDWRATIVPAVTIPVSLVGAFAVMYILDYSVNTLTLFALTLATGLVVDDAIVVLENIVRYIEENEMKPFRAAMGAMAEVVFAVIATTAVLVAVFVPVGFATGASGRLFTEFALTLAGSVVISTFVALTLAPAIAARILRRNGQMQGRAFRLIERFLEGWQNLYASSLRRLMSLKGLVVIGFFLSFALVGILFAQIPKEFLPIEDRARIITFIRAPQGVTIDYTDKVARQVEEIYSQMPDVRAYFSVGAFGRGAPGQVDQGITFVRLNHWDDRTQPEQSQQAIVGQLFGKFSQITDALVLPINPSSLPGSGFGQPIQFVLQGSDLEQLARVSGEFARRANELPQVVNIDTDLKLTKPELTLKVDRLAASNLGVSVRDISRTLQILLGSQEITSFNRGNRRYEVVVQAEKEFRSTPDSIREIYVKTRDNQLVPLSNLVSIETTTTPPQINHYNRFRAATIEGSPASGVSLGDALT
ncbi:MAG: efflux RND transporter permease subunit, partial [Cyanobacteria bacterium J055]